MILRSLAYGSSALLLALASGCTSDAQLTKLATAFYELGCQRNQALSPPLQCGGGDRTIDGEDGQDGISIACEVRPASNNGKQLDLQIVKIGAAGSRTSLQIQNARFGENGTLVNSGSAFFSLVDGGNTFRGTIGVNPPIPCDGTNTSTCQPCRISPLRIETDEAGSKYVAVEVLCDGLSRTTEGRDTREVTNQTLSTEPATIQVYFCDGI